MNILKAVHTVSELEGFISLNNWMEGPEVHMLLKGFEALHTDQKVEKEYRGHLSNPIRYSFTVEGITFLTVTKREVEHLESIIEDQKASV